MKKLIPLVLCLAACVTPPPATLPLDGPVGNTAERVVERYEGYVGEDADSAAARALLSQLEVHYVMLRTVMDPIMDAHDLHVLSDAQLIELERSIYLGDTERLRELLDEYARVNER